MTDNDEMPFNYTKQSVDTTLGAAGLGHQPPMTPPQASPKTPLQSLSASPRHVNRPVSEYVEEEEENRLAIDRDVVLNLEREGFSLQFVTSEVFGRPEPQHRARFERRGWVPVHQEDFNGRFRGKFMPESYEGEIKVDGLVLMARPVTWTRKAQEIERRRAQERIEIKQRQIAGGELPGVRGADHPSARASNKFTRSVETISVPESGR